VVQEIDVDELAARLGDGASVIDVREPDEYTGGHVPGAVSIPLATVADHLDEFAAAANGGPTLVICQAGGRSQRACELAAVHGIEAINVAGGTGAWIAAGRAVVSGNQPT